MSRKSRLVVWQKGKPMYSYKQILVENIQRLSKERGIGKTEACEESGAGRSFISNIIGKGQTPSFDKVLQLAQYFGVSVDYLVGYTPENEENPRIQKLIEFASRLTDEQLDGFIETYSKLLDSLKK